MRYIYKNNEGRNKNLRKIVNTSNVPIFINFYTVQAKEWRTWNKILEEGGSPCH